MLTQPCFNSFFHSKYQPEYMFMNGKIRVAFHINTFIIFPSAGIRLTGSSISFLLIRGIEITIRQYLKNFTGSFDGHFFLPVCP